jgi:hypothetical protein
MIITQKAGNLVLALGLRKACFTSAKNFIHSLHLVKPFVEFNPRGVL